MSDRKKAQGAVDRLNAKLDAHRDGLLETEDMMIQTWDDLFDLCKYYEAVVKKIKDERDASWERFCSTGAVCSASCGA